MAEYISDQTIANFLGHLHTHTASNLRKAQKWHIPFVITNTINQTYLSTYDENGGIDAISFNGEKRFKDIKAYYINEDVFSNYNNGDIIETKVYYMPKEKFNINNGEVEVIARIGEVDNPESYIIKDSSGSFITIKFVDADKSAEFYSQYGNKIINEEEVYNSLKNDYINSLSTASKATFNIEYLESSAALKLQINRRANINIVDRYRYDGRYYSHKYSVDDPDSAIGILEVDNLPYRSFSNRVNKKCFYGRLERLVYQGLIEPLMIFIDHKFVKWENIDVVYDSDESWIVLHGEQYAKEYLDDKEINIVVMPFRCEYIAEESDYSFSTNYEALTNYLQDNSYIENDELYIHIPTMEAVYRYNQYPVNVGGWMYYQIKKYHLGLLSEDRIHKLRYIPVFKYIRDSNMAIVNTKQTRFNALDRDSYTSEELYIYLNYMEFDNYAQFTRLRFNEDGLYDSENGEYNIYITNESTQIHLHDSSEQMIYCDLSEINNVLFR